ncbi:MAG: hypothetical protein HOV67_08765, partial [Kribbellaceae bacterium]|nr:hypothetical protein [Kribbellaceae bacterium]
MRHPADPDPIRDSKAVAAYALGWIAIVTSPLLGGVVPAVLALALARQARRDIAAGEGWRTGSALVGRGELLARLALGVAVLVVCVAVVVGVLHHAADPAHDFPPSV